MVYFRLLFFAVSFLALVVASVPLIVLINLASGETGYGLCPGGLGGCDMSYLRAVELSVVLMLIIFAFIALIRIAAVIRRRIDSAR